MPTFDDAQNKETFASKLQSVKLPLWAFLVLIVLLIGMVAARQLAVSGAERQIEAERQELARKFEADRAAIQARAQEALTRHSEEAHLLFGNALAWAIRSALVNNNLDEVDQYFAELVKNGRINLALLVNPDGKVVVATDRQFHGSKFSENFAPALLEGDRIALHKDGQQNRLVLPIRGLASRLGTAMVVYTAPAS